MNRDQSSMLHKLAAIVKKRTSNSQLIFSLFHGDIYQMFTINDYYVNDMCHRQCVITNVPSPMCHHQCAIANVSSPMCHHKCSSIHTSDTAMALFRLCYPTVSIKLTEQLIHKDPFADHCGLLVPTQTDFHRSNIFISV